MYCYFANIGHADMMCSALSSNCLESLHLLFLFVTFLSHNIWFVMPDLVLLLLLLLLLLLVGVVTVVQTKLGQNI